MYSHFCATAENLVSLRALFTKLHPDFGVLYILEFHGKRFLQYKTKHASVILQEN